MAVTFDGPNDMRTARYCGPSQDLTGRTALVRPAPGRPDVMLAQFDDRALSGGLGYGWHRFDAVCFEPHRNADGELL